MVVGRLGVKYANKFIRVFDELGTYPNFGLKALYMVATLPLIERNPEVTFRRKSTIWTASGTTGKYDELGSTNVGTYPQLGLRTTASGTRKTAQAKKARSENTKTIRVKILYTLVKIYICASVNEKEYYKKNTLKRINTLRQLRLKARWRYQSE